MLSGFIVERTALLNSTLGTDVRIAFGPQPEIVKMAEAGQIDGLTLIAPLDRRRKHFLFTDVFRHVPDFIFVRAEDPQKGKAPSALDDLCGKPVGYRSGTLRESLAVARCPEIAAVPVDGHARLAQRLPTACPAARRSKLRSKSSRRRYPARQRAEAVQPRTRQ